MTLDPDIDRARRAVPATLATPRAPGARRAAGPRQRRWLPLLVAVVALGLVASSCLALHEDNRAQPIFGARNGAIQSGWLTPVRSGCAVYWEAAVSIHAMIAQAARDGVTLTPTSCYRDYAGQVTARESWCALGACHMAAEPGTSNHGWGKAIDFAEGNQPMTYESPGYQWMLTWASYFGWMHPKVMKADGPVPEPWHWEWVGDGGKMAPGQYVGVHNKLPLRGSPIGNLDGWETQAGDPGRLRVVGWTFDPDQQEPIDVHVYLNGIGKGGFKADHYRPDVGIGYPAYSSRHHGFDVTFDVWPGAYRACAFAIESFGTGTNQLIGCKDLVVDRGGSVAAVPSSEPPTTVAPVPTTSTSSASTSPPEPATSPASSPSTSAPADAPG
jgi:hypothetical protein